MMLVIRVSSAHCGLRDSGFTGTLWKRMSRNTWPTKRCVLSKAPEPEARAPLVSIVATAPLELVCIDFWTAEDSNNKSIDVLVVTDHFTKLACAYPCPNQSAETVARVLWNNFFCVYGFADCIHSDRGANFESSLIAELLQLSGVGKSHTTPYHPMGNGQAERLNRTLGGMIRALPARSKAKWPQMLNTLTFSYNCTVHETTGFPPFFLMFGRTPRLPVDVMFESVLLDGDTVDVDKYVQSLGEDLREAMTLAQQHASKQQKRQAEVYNRRSKGHSVEKGDRVLLANKGERGKKKLADRWDSAVYIVVAKNSSLNTYRIQHPTTGRIKTVHRNLIMPVNFLPLPSWEEPESHRYLSSGDVFSEMSAASSKMDGSDARTVHWVASLPESSGRIFQEDGVVPVDGSEVERPYDVPLSEVCSVEVDQREIPKAYKSSDGETPFSGDGAVTDVVNLVEDALSVWSVAIYQDSDQSSDTTSVESVTESVLAPDRPSCSIPQPEVRPLSTVSAVRDIPARFLGEGVRTRLGRFIKPVNRLIQTMSTQEMKPFLVSQ